MNYDYSGGGLSNVVAPLQDLWANVVAFVPTLVGAIVVFVIGLVVATGLGMLVERILERIRLDSVLKQAGIGHYFDRAGMAFRPSRFFGQLVFWFIAIAGLLAASDLLGLAAFSDFLKSVVAYIPNVVIGILIALAAIVLGNFSSKAVQAGVKGAKMPASQFLGTLTWWAIVIFGLLSAFSQLGIAAVVIQSVVTGLVAMLALAGGLAFGLGGRDYASDLISKLREHTEDH